MIALLDSLKRWRDEIRFGSMTLSEPLEDAIPSPLEHQGSRAVLQDEESPFKIQVVDAGDNGVGVSGRVECLERVEDLLPSHGERIRKKRIHGEMGREVSELRSRSWAGVRSDDDGERRRVEVEKSVDEIRPCVDRYRGTLLQQFGGCHSQIPCAEMRRDLRRALKDEP